MIREPMLIISASCLDYFGDSSAPVSICDGATLQHLGHSDGQVSRRHLRYQGASYRCEPIKGSTSSAYMILRHTK